MGVSGAGAIVGPEKSARAEAMLRAGKSNKAIMQEVGIGSSVIKRLSHEIGIYRGAHGILLTKEEAAAVTEKRLATKTARGQIAAKPNGHAPVLAPSHPSARSASSTGIDPDKIVAIMKRNAIKTPAWSTLDVARALGLPVARKSQQLAATDVVRAAMTRDSRFQRNLGMWSLAEGTKDEDNDRPLTAEEESQKIQLLKAIVRFGPFDSEHDLTTALRQVPEIRIGGHEMTHLLYALKKQGKIDFRESSSGAAGYRQLRIESTVNGRAYVRTLGVKPPQNEKEPTLSVDRGSVAARPNGEGIGSVAPAAPAVIVKPDGTETVRPASDSVKPILAAELAKVLESPAPDWPLLTALRVREIEAAGRKHKAAKYLAAAEILADVDKAESERLLAQASDTAGDMLTPLEEEYLRFAEAHK